MRELTPNEVAARVQEFNEQHANLNAIEDMSMVILMGAILAYIIVMEYLDSRKTENK